MGHDVAGTLSGLWYLEGSDPSGTEFREDIAFHFGYHHLVADRPNAFDGMEFVRRQTGAGDLEPSLWIKGSPHMGEITPGSGLVKFELFHARSGLAGSFPDWTLEDGSGLDDATPTTTVLLVEMLDAETLRLERFDGTGISADDVAGFTTNARMYVRNPVG